MKPGNLLEQGIDVTKMGFEVPEHQPELRFDPERDVSAKDRQDMLSQLHERRQSNLRHRWLDFSALANNLHIIDPDLDLQIGDTEIQGMLETLNVRRNGNKEIITIASRIHALVPELQLPLTSKDQDEMARVVNFYRLHKQWDEFADLGSLYTSLYPGAVPKLSVEEQKEMLETLRARIAKPGIPTYPKFAAAIHLLYPEIVLHNLPEQAAMLALLNDSRKFGNSGHFASIAASLTELNKQPTEKLTLYAEPSLPIVKNF